MKRAKRCISAVMAAVMAFTANASVMAETAEPQTVDINGFSCYERDGQYWTVLDGEEYLVINLDEFTEPAAEDDSGISPYSGIVDECPIGTPPLLTDWIYNGCVELNAQNNYTCKDRCYLTYGDYYTPIYYFDTSNIGGSFVAEIRINDSIVTDYYHFKVWKHSKSNRQWYEGESRCFDFLLRHNVLVTSSTGEDTDGLGCRFLSSGVHDKEFYYTMNIRRQGV